VNESSYGRNLRHHEGSFSPKGGSSLNPFLADRWLKGESRILKVPAASRGVALNVLDRLPHSEPDSRSLGHLIRSYINELL